MRPLVLIGCFLLMAFMAIYEAGGMAGTYAAIAAVGSLLLSLK